MMKFHRIRYLFCTKKFLLMDLDPLVVCMDILYPAQNDCISKSEWLDLVRRTLFLPRWPALLHFSKAGTLKNRVSR